MSASNTGSPQEGREKRAGSPALSLKLEPDEMKSLEELYQPRAIIGKM